MTRTPRGLRFRMALHLGVMVAGSLLIGLAAVIGIDRLHQDYGAASRGYHQLRQLYDIGFQVATARRALSSNAPDTNTAIAALELADNELDHSSGWLNDLDKAQLRADIQQALAGVRHNDDAPRFGTSIPPEMDRIFSRLAGISQTVQTTIADKESAAVFQRRLTLGVIAGLSVIVVMTALLTGIRLYRAVVTPLDRIRTGVRKFAAGQWDQRVEGSTTDREFRTLADDFNHMAGELRALYQDLEQKVAQRSRELVRAERLASVGYLAAGVAHEINNPLGIIAGYGERSMQILDREIDETTVPKTRRAIAIMCEEAFRCRAITDRLLSLARPGSDEKRVVSLVSIAEEVVAVLAGVGEYANQRITLTTDPGDDCPVLARDGEMKQVILNLLVNALEASPGSQGLVRVSVKNASANVELVVEDNGKGMDRATLDRVFEPFFTDKRDAGRHGNGLGLSIVHAIATDHGGTITADSDGPGKGSRFVVRLPSPIAAARL
jgi:two-component system, NtrC family, sensor kinase